MTSWAALIVLAAVIAQSCAESPSANDDWAYTEHQWSYEAAVTPDLVLVHSGALLTARTEMELLDARPAHVDPGLEVLATRIVVRHDARSGHEWGDVLGACTDEWPPAGWGHMYPVRGFEIVAGDMIAVQVYLRATRTGDWTSSGIELDYRTAGGDRRTLTSGADIQGTARLFARDDPADFGDHPPCLVVPATESIFQPTGPPLARPVGAPTEEG